jgi:hypothetical protein
VLIASVASLSTALASIGFASTRSGAAIVPAFMASFALSLYEAQDSSARAILASEPCSIESVTGPLRSRVVACMSSLSGHSLCSDLTAVHWGADRVVELHTHASIAPGYEIVARRVCATTPWLVALETAVLRYTSSGAQRMLVDDGLNRMRAARAGAFLPFSATFLPLVFSATNGVIDLIPLAPTGVATRPSPAVRASPRQRGRGRLAPLPEGSRSCYTDS